MTKKARSNHVYPYFENFKAYVSYFLIEAMQP